MRTKGRARDYRGKPLGPQDFDFELPPELIAQAPAPERSASRLLHVRPDEGLDDLGIRDLPRLLNPGDLLVLNDTRVIKARLRGRKDTGGAFELLVERPLGGSRALAHVRASHAPRPGSRLLLPQGEALVVEARVGGLYRVALASGGDLLELLERVGEVPLPPYVGRAPVAEDEQRYQTVYARSPGAVAAPTAGLHFDAPLLAAVRKAGAGLVTLTLHVGAGTFRPVQEGDLDAHRMHAERFAIPEATARAVREARQDGRRVVAVGTTSLRALEAASLDAAEGEGPRPGPGETDLFIRPGFRFRAVDVLLTNFHLPRSTLLVLACAFAGTARVRAAYAHAIARRYRFFSYGDAMLLHRREDPET